MHASGPLRLVASGLKPPGAVKRAAFAAFGVAAVAGLVLAATTSWWLLAVGVAAIAAAWGYTGGPVPYGYIGLGEVFVFVFFGLVATVGTTYVAVERVTALAVVMGCAAGCLACALLVVNNLRDIPSDRSPASARWPCASAIGGRGGCMSDCVAAAYVLVLVAALWRPWVVLAVASAAFAVGTTDGDPAGRQWTGAAARARRDRPAATRLRRAGDGRPRPQRVTPSHAFERGDEVVGRSRWAVCPAPSMTASVASGIEPGDPLGEGDELGRRARRRRRAPASSAIGSRSHSGRCVPVPARRRLDASPAASLRRRSSRPGSASVANSGWATQRSRKASTSVVLDGRCKCIVRGSACRSLGVVLDAGRGADQHEPLDELRVGRARGGGRAGHPSSSRRMWPRPPAAPSSSAPASRPASIARRTAVARGVDRDDLEAIDRGAPAIGAHERPVWVKPWTRTRRGPPPEVDRVQPLSRHVARRAG